MTPAGSNVLYFHGPYHAYQHVPGAFAYPPYAEWLSLIVESRHFIDPLVEQFGPFGNRNSVPGKSIKLFASEATQGRRERRSKQC